jgi:hypothetical protein
VTHNPFILEQSADIALGESRYLVKIEITEGSAKILSLGEYHSPAQSGLKTLQAQLLEQTKIITDREAPFSVMLGKKFRIRATRLTARFAVGARNCCAHLLSS